MELGGKNVLIVGFERTGEALARFLVERGGGEFIGCDNFALSIAVCKLPEVDRSQSFSLVEQIRRS